MYSSSDFEWLFIRYKAEAMTVEGVHKWYKDTRHQIVPVHVEGHPAADSDSPTEVSSSPVPESKTDTESVPVRIMIGIRMTNGMRIQQRNLTYLIKKSNIKTGRLTPNN